MVVDRTQDLPNAPEKTVILTQEQLQDTTEMAI